MLLAMTIAFHAALLVPTPADGTTLSGVTTRRTAIFSAVAIGFQPMAAMAEDSDGEFSARLSSVRNMLDNSKSTMVESPDRVRFAIATTMPYLTYKGYRCAHIPARVSHPNMPVPSPNSKPLSSSATTEYACATCGTSRASLLIVSRLYLRQGPVGEVEGGRDER